MSTFAHRLRARVSGRTAPVSPTRGAVPAASRAMAHLLSTNTSCAADERCQTVARALSLVRTPADAKTALTQVQQLLETLTAEDADVADDLQLQKFRKQLHLLLDH